MMTAKSVINNETKNYAVLLMEDEPADIILGKNIILDVWLSASVAIVSSQAGAYKSLSECDFNSVLLDWNLSNAYGAATLKEVRKYNKRVPIIMLTGMGIVITLCNAIKWGANHATLKSQILDEEFQTILEQHVQETLQ